MRTSVVAVLAFFGSLSVCTAVSADATTADSSATPGLPGTLKKESHQMSPWQTPQQAGAGAQFSVLQAKCGDDLRFFWNSEKHGLFLLPSGTCPDRFEDSQAEGIMELMPVTTEGNVTIDLDEPGRFWFADPLYCRSHNMILQVSVRCKNEAPRFSEHGLRSWEDPEVPTPPRKVFAQGSVNSAAASKSAAASLSKALPKEQAHVESWDVEAASQFPDGRPGHDLTVTRRLMRS